MTTRPGYVWDSATSEWVEIGQAAVVAPVKYQASAPTSPATGDIWIDSDDEVPGITSSLNYRWRRIATGGETSLSGNDSSGLPLAYNPGYEQVYLNGVLLYRGDDYTATTGTTITGLTALVASDTIEVLSFVTAPIGDTYTQAAADAKFVSTVNNGMFLVKPTSVTGGTVSANGAITIGSAVTSIAVNGVFSSAHENYRILLHLDNHNGGASVEFQLQGITSGYFTTGYYMSFGVSTMTGYTSASTDRWFCNFNNQSTYSSAFQMDLMSPNLAKRKVCAVTGQGANGPSQISGTNNSATQSTGFTITKSSDTMTGGTIRIYGYNNGA
jgi:hypothetical protein